MICEPADHFSFTPLGISLFGTLPSILCSMLSRLALSLITVSSSTLMCCYCIKRISPANKYTSSCSTSAPVLRQPVPSSLTLHSFCIRAATTAGAEGLPDQLIKVLGRWKPLCIPDINQDTQTQYSWHTLLTPHGQFCIPLTCIFVNFLLLLRFWYCLGLQAHYLAPQKEQDKMILRILV